MTLSTLPAFMKIITKMYYLPLFSLVGVTGIELVNGIAQKRQIYCFTVCIELIT
jgi:hypothetical protein